MKYRCVETFTVPELDGFEGDRTGNDYQIDEGSVWQSEEPVNDNATEVFLTQEDGAWIDIHKGLFDLMFEPIEEGEA